MSLVSWPLGSITLLRLVSCSCALSAFAGVPQAAPAGCSAAEQTSARLNTKPEANKHFLLVVFFLSAMLLFPKFSFVLLSCCSTRARSAYFITCVGRVGFLFGEELY